MQATYISYETEIKTSQIKDGITENIQIDLKPVETSIYKESKISMEQQLISFFNPQTIDHRR